MLSLWVDQAPGPLCSCVFGFVPLVLVTTKELPPPPPWRATPLCKETQKYLAQAGLPGSQWALGSVGGPV